MNVKKRKILACCGRPGSGKTTLFRKFMEDKVFEDMQLVKLVPSMYCKELDLHIIGKYEDGEVFAGTDRLSMAVMPAAVEFVQTVQSNIIFEGDRLTSGKFLELLNGLPNTEFKLIVISADDKILQERYDDRGSNQSEQFLSGRVTKINNITSNMELMFVTDNFVNNNFDDQQKILDCINNFLEIA